LSWRCAIEAPAGPAGGNPVHLSTAQKYLDIKKKTGAAQLGQRWHAPRTNFTKVLKNISVSSW
jgi:hypothetical protein